MIAFIYADLLILPILNIYRKCYGARMAAFLLVTFFAAMAVAGYVDPRGRDHLERHDLAQHGVSAADRESARTVLAHRRPSDTGDEGRLTRSR